MKMTLKNNVRENLPTCMRRLGYIYLRDNGHEWSFVRPLDRNRYPRFHTYITQNKDATEFHINLHLDQKKAIYKGHTAHNADYAGANVEEEAARIRSFIEGTDR